MRRPKKRGIPRVIQEQIEGLVRERDEANGKLIKANGELIETRADLARVEQVYDNLHSTFAELKKALDDVRRQRDNYKSEVENIRYALRDKELALARVMGWVDATRNVPPHIEAPLEVPF